jgi:hypothetical protein
MIEPKQQFLSQLPAESNFRNVIISDVFQRALILSFTQLAIETISPEQLKGAKRFVEILTDIGTPSAPPKDFPDKKLDHSVFHSPQEQPKKTKKKAT